jgi:predicted N-acetyltransferase YhbS
MERCRESSRSVIVRPMTHGDIDDGLRLCRASNWNQLEDDWRLFLDRGRAFVAVQDTAIVGSVAHLPFGRDFTWLSMMLVDPAARRSGIGTRLMQACLDDIGDGVSVRLDATPAGEPLYRQFGFVDEYPLDRARITADPERHRASPSIRPLTPADLPEIAARDLEVFGADRTALLADLLRRAPDLAWRSETAYCFGRPGHLFPQIGPVVADDAASARAVVDHCLSAQIGRSFVMDVPRPNAFDLTPDRPFLRMSLRERRDHGRPDHVFAITGPEFA